MIDRPQHPHLVGASVLAKIVNDNADILNERGALGLFARPSDYRGS